VLFGAPATAALAALGVWLVFALFWSVLTPLVTTLVVGPAEGALGPRLAYLHTTQILDRLSPNTLYAETALALLQPATRALGPVLISQLRGALLGAPSVGLVLGAAAGATVGAATSPSQVDFGKPVWR